MSHAPAWRSGPARAWALGGRTLRFASAPSRERTASPEVERVWSDLRRRIPAIFDGPVWAVDAWDGDTHALVCRRSSYKPFACGLAGAPVDEWLLAVTGLVCRAEPNGGLSVLMGRRGGATWLYQGMWELGPSGGVQPGAEAAPTLADLRSQLAAELREEVGIAADCSGAEPVAVCTDPAARSLDVVLRVETYDTGPGIAGVVHPQGEYSETRWVRRADLAAFCRDAPGGVIAPTIEALRALGWIG